MPPDLQAAYETAAREWVRLSQTHPGLSAPLLVDPSAEYQRIAIRLMIVGQETKNWGKDASCSLPATAAVARLREIYREFDLGVHYHSTPFWCAANQVSHALNPHAKTRAFVWSNLVKWDCARQRPDADLEGAIARLELLQAELVAFAPHVVLFFTGPTYDARLLRTFPGAHIQPLAKGTACIEHPALPAHAFRTYHPAYLRRSRQWSVLDDLVQWCQVA